MSNTILENLLQQAAEREDTAQKLRLLDDPQFGFKCDFCHSPVVVPEHGDPESHPGRIRATLDAVNTISTPLGSKSKITCIRCQN